MSETTITIFDVERVWQRHSDTVDLLQYQFETGRIDEGQYYAELAASLQEAETIQEIWLGEDEGVSFPITQTQLTEGSLVSSQV